MQEITLGTEKLSPTFSSSVYEYNVTASGASAVVNAVPNQAGKATDIRITYDGKNVNNGSQITFVSGKKPLTITVKRGNSKLVYTVNVSK